MLSKKKINTKILLIVAILIALVIIFVVVKSFNSKENTSTHEFTLKNNVLASSQEGKISLINIASKNVFSTIDLSKEVEKNYTAILPVEGNSILSKYNKEEPKIEEIIEEVIKEAPTEIIPNSLISRDVKVVGERDGYDIVSVKIIKGDYWLKIQKQLVEGLTTGKMLAIGREINGKQPLHPIYSGNKLLFLAKKGLFTTGIVTEEKIEEIKEEIIEEQIPEINTDGLTIEKLDIMDKTKKDSSINNYVYSFSENGFYVYDNLNYRLYEINLNKDVVSLKLICDTKDVIIKDFQFKNNIFYFTTFDNLNIYAFDGIEFAKILIDSDIESWTADDECVYYTAIETIYKVNVQTGEQIHLYLGDKTTDIEVIGDKLYVANKFGSTIAKSVLHKLDKDLISYGWAELNYAKDTDIVYEKDNEFLIQQNLHGEKDKLVYINTKFELEYEVALDVLTNDLKVHDSKYIYGISNDAFYLYDMQGTYLDAIKLNVSDAFILK